MVSLKQKIAQKEDELARLKQKERSLENGQKIIIGGMMISLAKRDKTIAQALLKYIETEVTRDTDKKRLTELVEELR